jgi:dihydrodipicolinate synthase/N-acetylneuraminate lyase
MLTRERLRGMWVSIPTEWAGDGSFDEKTFRDEAAMLIDAGAHGLYTTGSTGEFYALDWEEFTRVTDSFLAETAGKIPVQVGCNWFNTRDTIKRVRYARDGGADAVQVCFPGWMTMPEEHYDRFLEDVAAAVPDIALIHYNISRAGKLFSGEDYARVLPRVPTMIGTKAGVPLDARVLPRVPTMIGTKAGVPLDAFTDLVTRAPELNHFVGEVSFALAHQLGAPGMYTSWFMMNPAFLHEYYSSCTEGRYAEAIAVSKRLRRWFDEALGPLIQKGYMDPTLDKAFVEMGGWLPGNRRTRAPHYPLTDEEFTGLREATERIMPEFLGYAPSRAHTGDTA